MEIYQCRQQQNTGLVEVYSASLLATSSPKCFSYERTIKVLTEHIPFRLPDFSELKLNDCMYIINRALRYFKILYDRLGYFEITEGMFCFNYKGELRVWINDNLSANHPKVRHEFIQRAITSNDLSHISESENQMIHRIFECVERYSDGGRLPANFTEPLKVTNLTFQNTLIII
jgi:hypothetical protein